MSGIRRRLLIFGYPLLEVATAYVVGALIGWGWMLLLLVAGIPIGFALMRNAADAAMRDAITATSAGQPIDSSRHTLAFVGGLLVAVPGFWTDLVGLLLVLPITQRLFRQRARTWFEARVTTVHMPGIHYPGGDVIQGTIIHPDESPPPKPPTIPPAVNGPEQP